MRKITKINDNWQFSTDHKNFTNVTLPHTWNNLDGQDGGGDYLRQTCYYQRKWSITKGENKVFLQFEGVNHIAEVTFNGTFLGEHRGGFSTFRFEITDLIKNGENLLEVSANNSESIPVYPQQADFTFFGGIYRDVSLIEVGYAHFDLEFYGSNGVYITPKVVGNTAEIAVLSYLKGEVTGADVTIQIQDGSGNIVASVSNPASKKLEQSLVISDPILWNGRKKGKESAHLYTLNIEIKKENVVTDRQSIPFGVRSFEVDKDRGYLLNGEDYSLHGVSRHQCRQDKGWAISHADQDQDMALISELGANTIRLAHYQHSQYFYDLCDQEGMVVWAEIPFITVFIESQEATDNTKTQMHELILQNYNHPSVCFWGISNEVTLAGETPELVQAQKDLVEIIKSYDQTRLSALANITFVGMDSPQNFLTDIIGYNHYFGWYGGDLTENEKWIDTFHEKYPDRPLAITEYGAEGIMTLHTENPVCRDYTEEYHAVYHEHMLNIFQTRPFLWGTYQWNMFDFAADARDEGGVVGRNNKGLVSFDRNVKKDAFYLYKAYWNQHDPFVHLCGRRFVDRVDMTTIKVYSNQSEVELQVNGATIATQTGDKIFRFEGVKLQQGENIVVAKSKDSSDEITIRGVDTPNQSYILPVDEEEASDKSEGAKNWFLELQAKVSGTGEMTYNEGYFSLKDKVSDLLAHPEAGAVITGLLANAQGGVKLSEGTMKMIAEMQMEMVLQLAGGKLPPDAPYCLNQSLQVIKK
ncbi:MAG: glycoside hydrolase family 2 TIM barrel-domain containing protein [Eubacteriales bacterium]